MTIKNLHKRKYRMSRKTSNGSVLNTWWLWEDRDSNYDRTPSQIQALSNDLPMSQMDELQEVVQ